MFHLLVMLNIFLFPQNVKVESFLYKVSDNLQGWNYINLHCRDNENDPVDWWYIYKPPSDPAESMFKTGRNFSFITPATKGRWQPSDKYITANSMLQHTLAPLYRPTYTDYLASIVYDEKEKDDTSEGSSALGVLMADEMGGVWLGHTVPGLPDLYRDRPIFPEDELNNGHLITCMSLDLLTLNEIAASLREVLPKIIRIQIPPAMKSTLPDWHYFNVPPKQPVRKSNLDFVTREKGLRVSVMVRRPGDKKCLYKTFAKNKRLVLDVYGHDGGRRPRCYKKYSVRNIDAISLKYPEQVLYINNETDRVGFAVSTAAQWQRIGTGPVQYWACTSNLEKVDGTAKGGLILCVEDYYVWLSFDNFKIKEPEC